MKKLLLILVLVAVSSSSVAAEKDYKICSIAGFLQGEDSSFIASVARHIMNKRIDMNDPVCTAAYKDAVEIGQHMSRTGKIRNQTDKTVIFQAVDFKSELFNAVTSNMNYK
jgi:hypothetical protein